MSSETGVCVAAFHVTYSVLKAEKLLREREVTVKLIPVPRQISSSCGIALRFDCRSLALVLEVIAPVTADMEGIYRREDDESYRRL
jgi:hypothetical protein